MAIRRADIVVVRSVGVVRCVGVRYEDEESEPLIVRIGGDVVEAFADGLEALEVVMLVEE